MIVTNNTHEHGSHNNITRCQQHKKQSTRKQNFKLPQNFNIEKKWLKKKDVTYSYCDSKTITITTMKSRKTKNTDNIITAKNKKKDISIALSIIEKQWKWSFKGINQYRTHELRIEQHTHHYDDNCIFNIQRIIDEDYCSCT